MTMMFSKGSSFEKLLDKATSHLNVEVDWPSVIQICDLIRQGDLTAKNALASIKKKMTNTNPHVVMFSLSVLESVVKNCGTPVHDEIGTKAYMEMMRELIKTNPNETVRTKLLGLLQTWAHAFRNNQKYRAIQDTVNILKTDGFKFPALKENDAMFSADTAPDWAEGDTCNRCRVSFGIFERKHHCRNCGQVFCSRCTSQSCILPKFGFEREVRVCDRCYEKVQKSNAKSDDLPAEYLSSPLSQQNQAPPRRSAAEIKAEEDLKKALALSLEQAKAQPSRKTEAELKEEEELQMAIALSQSEAEEKNKISSRPKSYSPPAKLSTSPEADPELARYLNRSYWQQQSIENTNASAPSQPYIQTVPTQNGVEDEKMDEFVTALRSQVEIFVNRMKSNSSRGRPITNDSSVQTLFLNITALHSKLLKYIQQQEDSRVYFEGLQDKLVQVKDAREALDALREEHKERLRREAELAERQRQMQMAQKLDIMRKKKQEYLQYQRQLALQRMQEQEREMQMRQEQQKQQYMMGPYAPYGYDPRFPNPPHNFPPPYNPDPIMAQHMGVPMMQGPMPMGMPLSPPHMMGQAPPIDQAPPLNQMMRPMPQAPPMSPAPSMTHMMMPPMGQPPIGQPPMGQPPIGQPPMGQPPIGQPPMGQPPIGQPPMGQPPMSQPPMGLPPIGQQMSMSQLPHVLPQQPADVKKEENTAELISFD